MSLPGPLREGKISEITEEGGIIKLTDNKKGKGKEVRFLFKWRAHLEISTKKNAKLLLKHGLNGSTQASEPTKHTEVICILSKKTGFRTVQFWAIADDYQKVVEEWRVKKEALKVPPDLRQQLLNAQAITERARVKLANKRALLGKPNPQGLQKAVVVDMDRQRGIGHAKMGCGLIVCIQVGTFHSTVSTGNSQKPYDVGEPTNCPSIQNNEKIILYLPETNPPKREHPCPIKWALAHNGGRQQKAPYRNDRGRYAGGCSAAKPKTRR